MRKFFGVAISLTLISASVLLAQPAQALDSSSIRLSALSVNSGSPIRVEVPSLYSAKTCTFALNGPKKTKSVKVKVRKWTAKVALKTSGLPAGAYVVRVNCGKSGSATSTKFSIVPAGSPTKATCEVTESGFSAGGGGTTTYGVRIANRSPALVASSVQLAITFLDASNNTLATESKYATKIPAGENVYVGGNADVSNVANVRVDTICESSGEPTDPILRGQAQSIKPRNSDYYPIEIGGLIPNPLNFTISDFTSLNYVTRNAAGAITGGGGTFADAFIPAGATGTWSTMSVMYPQNVVSVDWTMAAEPK